MAAAGCGGTTQAPPKLRKADAGALATLARRVETHAGDACATRRAISALSAKTHSLVAAGRVPLRLRAPLLAGVRTLAADAPRCAPAPAATTATATTPAPAAAHAPPPHAPPTHAKPPKPPKPAKPHPEPPHPAPHDHGKRR